MGRLGKRKRGEKSGEGGGGEGLSQGLGHINCFLIKDLVDTDVRNIVCDPPIARIDHICRGLLYAHCCWV